MKIKTCKECGETYPVNETNFKLKKIENRGNKVWRTFSSRCIRKSCYHKNKQDYQLSYYHKRKELAKLNYYLRPDVRFSATIGAKTEPYFEGENFGYMAPSYEEIKKEYKL